MPRTPRTPADEHARRKRRLITLIAAGIVFALLAGVGIYGLIIGPPDTEPRPPAPHAPGPDPTPSQTSSPEAQTLQPLAATADPERFARQVTHALFDWDTHTVLTPEDHRLRLIEVADLTGEETPGLIADLDNYLPTDAVWTQLQEYQTSQRIDIDRVYVPDQLDEALAAGGAALEEGTIAYTIEGTRHRAGVWLDDPAASEHPVEFTMFFACEPRFEQCRLLRLSVLGEALE